MQVYLQSWNWGISHRFVMFVVHVANRKKRLLRVVNCKTSVQKHLTCFIRNTCKYLAQRSTISLLSAQLMPSPADFTGCFNGINREHFFFHWYSKPVFVLFVYIWLWVLRIFWKLKDSHVLCIFFSLLCCVDRLSCDKVQEPCACYTMLMSEEYQDLYLMHTNTNMFFFLLVF